MLGVGVGAVEGGAEATIDELPSVDEAGAGWRSVGPGHERGQHPETDHDHDRQDSEDEHGAPSHRIAFELIMR